ncbi:hypothetical protein F0562_024155 [Nyssa sinensis]|uniref:Uncharacterized protein n=1 Tax=Nyssa sinensis TaxID=561372 RepID=A0A5J5BEF8_9ASTE|nr:hypothetical protein F0562_024155 [Nyssa sinensis]
MEIAGEDGSIILLKEGFKREFGRGFGFDSNDRTVSRRQVLLQLHRDENRTGPLSKTRVFFEVIGKNPIWVYNLANREIRVFRRFERGEMETGDMFCVSGKKPKWFTLKRIEFEGADENEMKSKLWNENELAESLQISRGLGGVEDLEQESVDVSDIDAVKEFGFLVIGHEFDHYPRKMIRDAKNWNWFLEEPKGDSDDDEILEKKRKYGVRKKREKADGNGDDDWTGESEDGVESITRLKKARRTSYTTRSKDPGKPIKDTRVGKQSIQKKAIANEEDEDDENDDTLGGFIVNDDDVEEEEEEENDEEEDFDEEIED